MHVRLFQSTYIIQYLKKTLHAHLLLLLSFLLLLFIIIIITAIICYPVVVGSTILYWFNLNSTLSLESSLIEFQIQRSTIITSNKYTLKYLRVLIRSLVYYAKFCIYTWNGWLCLTYEWHLFNPSHVFWLLLLVIICYINRMGVNTGRMKILQVRGTGLERRKK